MNFSPLMLIPLALLLVSCGTVGDGLQKAGNGLFAIGASPMEAIGWPGVIMAPIAIVGLGIHEAGSAIGGETTFFLE